MSAQDALFLSVHTGELSSPMNGSYGTCTIGRAAAGARLANTANARIALFRTSVDGSLIPYMDGVSHGFADSFLPISRSTRSQRTGEGTVKLTYDRQTAAQVAGFVAAPDRNPLGVGQTVFRQLDNAHRDDDRRHGAPVRGQVRRVVAEGRCDERVVAHPCVYEAKVEHQAKSSIPVSIMSNVGA